MHSPTGTGLQFQKAVLVIFWYLSLTNQRQSPWKGWMLGFYGYLSLKTPFIIFQLSVSDKNASCSWFQNTVILILNSWHYFLMSYVDASTWPLLDQCHPGKTNSLSCRPPPTVVDWFSRVSRLNILNRWRGQKDIVNIQDITKLPLPSDLLAY